MPKKNPNNITINEIKENNILDSKKNKSEQEIQKVKVPKKVITKIKKTKEEIIPSNKNTETSNKVKPKKGQNNTIIEEKKEIITEEIKEVKIPEVKKEEEIKNTDTVLPKNGMGVLEKNTDTVIPDKKQTLRERRRALLRKYNIDTSSDSDSDSDISSYKYKKSDTDSSSDSDTVSSSDSDSDSYKSSYKSSSDSSSDSDTESEKELPKKPEIIKNATNGFFNKNVEPEVIKEKNYYKILRVSPTATVKEIRQAYKMLASIWHPDKFITQTPERKKVSEENFKIISEAKEVLTDAEKREIYDREGKSGLDNMTGKTDKQVRFMSKMRMFFRKLQKDDSIPDVECTQDVTLEDLYYGKEITKQIERYVLCKACDGHGTRDKQKHDCETCNGSGKVYRNGRDGICGDCYGYGFETDKCRECSGRKHVKQDHQITFTLPRGAFHRCILTVKEEGHDVLLEHQDGEYKNTDVLVYLREEEHPIFKRGWRIKKYSRKITDADLLIKLKVDIAEVLTGLNKKIKTIDGEEIMIKTDYYVKAGDIMMIPNKGMYKYTPETEFSSFHMDSENEEEEEEKKRKKAAKNLEPERGNLYIKFIITYPTRMFPDSSKKKIWKALKDTIPYNDPDKEKNVVELTSIRTHMFNDFDGDDRTDNEMDEYRHQERTAFQNKTRTGFRYPGGFPNTYGSNGHPWMRSRYKHLIP